MAKHHLCIFTVLVLASAACADMAPPDEGSAIATAEAEDWPDEAPVYFVDDATGVDLWLEADLLVAEPTYQSWVARAHDASTGDVVARVIADVDYGVEETVASLMYERFPSRTNLEPIPFVARTVTYPTRLDELGAPVLLTSGDTAFLVAALALDPAPVGGAAAGQSWETDGCSGPCSDRWRSCCIEHDECYCAGGTENDRKACDDQFRACLKAAGAGGFRAWIYWKATRWFGGAYFNYTEAAGGGGGGGW